MEKQGVKFNQTDWVEHNETKSQSRGFGDFFSGLFKWLVRLVALLVATPVYIVIWTINFIKSLFGMFVIWILGKVCIFLFIGLVFGLFHNLLGWISEDVAESSMTWYVVNVMGMDSFPDTADRFFMFPHFNVEVWFIIILALIIATTATFEKTASWQE